jgi:hypothetical protein
MNETMNIRAEHGDKVIVTEDTKSNGYDFHKEQVERLLKIGVPYTVNYTNVGDWSTVVHLVEFPGESFNSVNFEDYIDLDSEIVDEILGIIKNQGFQITYSWGETNVDEEQSIKKELAIELVRYVRSM